MKQSCNIEQLSYEGRWVDVFDCLGIDSETTVNLRDLSVPSLENTFYVHKHTEPSNILDIVLTLILRTDQFFLLLALLCFGFVCVFTYIKPSVCPLCKYQD